MKGASLVAKKILVVNSSGRVAGSVSRDLVDTLVKKLAPASIVTRETATAPFVDKYWISSCFNVAATDEDKNSHAFTTSATCVNELIDADVIVIGLGLYNFNLPASLKAWVDMVVVTRKTFQYGPTGPQPLLTPYGKKAFIVVASNGVPIGSPVEFATPYLKHVLRFMGITDVTVISATGGKKEEALKQIEEIVQDFPYLRRPLL